ncbi:MAG: hypothetical protein WDZ94_03725 [Patescibacteria group bacterium]
MKQSFFHQDFLKHVDLNLFNQYLLSKNLTEISTPDSKADKAQAMSDYLVSLTDADGDIVVNDLMVVRDLSSDGGVIAIMELSEEATFKQALSELTSNINRVLYCLLYKPDLIEPALKLKQITATENFHVRRVTKSVEADQVLAKLPEFKLELTAFLQKEEAKGANCQIDSYQFKDRVCFFAYPEDHPKSLNLYQNGKLNPTVVHPSFELVFVYYPEMKQLEIATRMRSKKLQTLFNLFNRAVLDDSQPVPNNQDTLNLDVLLTDGFSFIFDPSYQVDSICVTQIRLDYKYNRKKRFITHVDEGNGMEQILEELKYRNLRGDSLQHYVVAQATIKLRFKQFGRSNRVTTLLTAPDKIKLNETNPHQLAKKCLQDWKIINEPLTDAE